MNGVQILTASTNLNLQFDLKSPKLEMYMQCYN